GPRPGLRRAFRRAPGLGRPEDGFGPGAIDRPMLPRAPQARAPRGDRTVALADLRGCPQRARPLRRRAEGRPPGDRVVADLETPAPGGLGLVRHRPGETRRLDPRRGPRVAVRRRPDPGRAGLADVRVPSSPGARPGRGRP